jgi:NAD(P)-dependent dehydrogenase (short-subunit alcohol dehydrogenase family)
MPSAKESKALIVGSSGLLGPIWEKALRESGLNVTTSDLDGGSCDIQVDLTRPESIQELCGAISNLDVVILNAGIDSKVQSQSASPGGFDHDSWTQFFQVNVIGQAQLIETLIPKLNRGAVVVAIGSMYGLVAPRIDVYNPEGQPVRFIKHPAYGASKAALLNLLRHYAVRFAGQASFNMLTLGVVDSSQQEHFRTSMPKQIPTGSFLEPLTLGKHLRSLVDNADLNVTGQNFVVDGGYTLW